MSELPRASTSNLEELLPDVPVHLVEKRPTATEEQIRASTSLLARTDNQQSSSMMHGERGVTNIGSAAGTRQ